MHTASNSLSPSGAGTGLSTASSLRYRFLPAPLYWRWRAIRTKWLRGRNEKELQLLPYIVPRDRRAIDVGANRGVYTYFLSGLCPSVSAYEPNPWMADFLRRGCPANVEVHEAAVSDEEGTTPFFVPLSPNGKPRHNRSRIHYEGEATTKRFDVPCLRLDEIERDPVGFMKVDVEGHEDAVLKGAEGILDRDRPVLLVEILHLRRTNQCQTVQWLNDKGYAGFAMVNGALEPLNRTDLGQRGRNFIFLPTA